MPYKSEKQRRFLHARHPEIAARWDAEISGKKKRTVSKAQLVYAPAPLANRRMDDEALARAKDRQKYFALTGSSLGVTGLGLLGAGAAMKGKNPQRAAKLNNAAANTSITAGGIGALSGINFARIQGEESKRAREIKKSNYGAGYSQYYSEPAEIESVPVRQRVADADWKSKAPFTISRRAADPERSRERRARVYPTAFTGAALGAGGLTVREALKEKKPSAHLDTKLFRNKGLRVGAGIAATAALATGAKYHSDANNRKSYADEGWYPARERY